MQVNELLKLSEWFKNYIVDAKIPQYYTNLHNKLNQNAKPAQNQARLPFESEKKNLFAAIEKINFEKLSQEQIKFLEHLKVADKFGKIGVKKIEAVLYENSLDIVTAAQEIGNFTGKINAAQSTLNQFSQTLGNHFKSDIDDEIPSDSVYMRIYFQQNSSINNLTDFKKMAANWHEIGRGIAMAQNKTPEDFNIIGAQKGSVVIDLVVCAAIASSVSTIILASLKVVEKVLSIWEQVEKIKNLGLNNEKIALELAKEAKREQEEGVASILDAAILQLGLDKEKDGDKIVALEKSIKKLVEFTEKGGYVDFIQPDDEEEEEEALEENEEGVDEEEETDETSNDREEINRLKGNIQEIRKLENALRLIEHSKGKEEN